MNWPVKWPVKWPRDRALATILLLGLALHAAVLAGDHASPYGRTPINDAAYYWEWAGRVAEGELLGDAPFFSAPLYPYVLGVLRAAGVCLTGVLVLQMLLHVATGALLARVGARLFERRVGLLACGLWLLLTGPAASHGRVLAGTLQTFLVALLLERALALADAPGTRRAAGLGLVAGVASLAWPALLPAALVLAGWAVWIGAGRAGGAALLGTTVLAVAPATAHNWLAAEAFVPISAHAGITFWHGNNPSAEGVFAAHGVSPVKAEHDEDALRQTRAALGPDAGWADVSPYFLRKGLAWWAEEPARAVGLALEKAWLFLSARVYGDMYLPVLERDVGLWRSLWLAPLPVAWLIPPALAAAVLCLRRDPRRTLPAALVLVLPLAICTVFWYSPRYRLPAVPAASLLAAWAWVELARRRGRAPLLAGATVLALASGWINRAAGVDAAGDLRREVAGRGADMALEEGRVDQALDLLRGMLRRDPSDAPARLRLLEVLRERGRWDELVGALERWLEHDPWNGAARARLAFALATAPDAAVRDGARALEIARALAEQDAGRDPASLDVLAAALAEVGRTTEAVEVALRAARLHRRAGERAKAEQVEARLARYRAGEPFRQ